MAQGVEHHPSVSPQAKSQNCQRGWKKKLKKGSSSIPLGLGYLFNPANLFLKVLVTTFK
jgi:hypothetical protein